jgi:TM2 domain-containing membrane protein YozV
MSDINRPPAIAGGDAARMMQYDAAKKSPVVAYLLWFFLGGLGVHRFYLGRITSGIIMAIVFGLSWVTTIIGIGFLGLGIIGIWWVIDAVLIPAMVTSSNQALATRLSQG